MVLSSSRPIPCRPYSPEPIARPKVHPPTDDGRRRSVQGERGGHWNPPESQVREGSGTTGTPEREAEKFEGFVHDTVCNFYGLSGQGRS